MLHRKEAARGRGTRWYPQGRGRMRENAVPALFRAKKKDSGALSARRSLRKILGGGLLSHMKICSIIGDKELNFRVRNGIGCTLFSMATKKFW